MSSHHTLEIQLLLEVVADPMGARGRLTWELSVDHGPAAAGPAGVAVVHLPGGVRVSCDYAEPSRLLQVEVPAGWVDRVDIDWPASSRVEVDDAHLDLLEVLLGSAAVSMLRSTTADPVIGMVEARPSWEVMGRIALAHQVLADRDQPISGVWALEFSHLLAELGGGSVCDTYRQDLLTAATPALGLLPASLADRILADVAPLGHLLLVTARREGHGFGPLDEELASRNAAAAIEDANQIVAEAAPPAAVLLRGADRSALVDAGPMSPGGRSPVFQGGAIPSFRGGPGASATAAALLVDHSAGLLVSGASASVGPDDEGGETLTVRYAARPGAAAGPLRRLEVLVTGPEGLIAASVSAGEGPNGFIVGLPLPPSATGQHLDVVLGRNLPLGPLDAFGFHERQAVHAVRRLLDADRTQSGGEALVQRSLDAAREWRSAGRADLADAIGDLIVQVPFISEDATRVLDVGRDLPTMRALPWEAKPTTPLEVLSAARDLAWSLGDPEMAALLERQRFVRTGEPELPLASHDALTLALAVTSPQDARDLTLHLL